MFKEIFKKSLYYNTRIFYKLSQFSKGQFPILHAEIDVFFTSKPCNLFLGDRDVYKPKRNPDSYL